MKQERMRWICARQSKIRNDSIAIGEARGEARGILSTLLSLVKDGSTGKLKLKASLSKCGRTSVENKVEYIRQNVPELFADEEE